MTRSNSPTHVWVLIGKTQHHATLLRKSSIPGDEETTLVKWSSNGKEEWVATSSVTSDSELLGNGRRRRGSRRSPSATATATPTPSLASSSSPSSRKKAPNKKRVLPAAKEGEGGKKKRRKRTKQEKRKPLTETKNGQDDQEPNVQKVDDDGDSEDELPISKLKQRATKAKNRTSTKVRAVPTSSRKSANMVNNDEVKTKEKILDTQVDDEDDLPIAKLRKKAEKATAGTPAAAAAAAAAVVAETVPTTNMKPEAEVRTAGTKATERSSHPSVNGIELAPLARDTIFSPSLTLNLLQSQNKISAPSSTDQVLRTETKKDRTDVEEKPIHDICKVLLNPSPTEDKPSVSNNLKPSLAKIPSLTPEMKVKKDEMKATIKPPSSSPNDTTSPTMQYQTEVSRSEMRSRSQASTPSSNGLTPPSAGKVHFSPNVTIFPTQNQTVASAQASTPSSTGLTPPSAGKVKFQLQEKKDARATSSFQQKKKKQGKAIPTIRSTAPSTLTPTAPTAPNLTSNKVKIATRRVSLPRNEKTGLLLEGLHAKSLEPSPFQKQIRQPPRTYKNLTPTPASNSAGTTTVMVTPAVAQLLNPAAVAAAMKNKKILGSSYPQVDDWHIDESDDELEITGKPTNQDGTFFQPKKQQPLIKKPGDGRQKISPHAGERKSPYHNASTFYDNPLSKRVASVAALKKSPRVSPTSRVSPKVASSKFSPFASVAGACRTTPKGTLSAATTRTKTLEQVYHEAYNEAQQFMDGLLGPSKQQGKRLV